MCRACNRRSSSDAYWRRQYGITKAEVDRLRASQDDRCAICGDAGPEHLDHDHDSGRVRSLLCQRCNFGLGQFRDDPVVLRAAAHYIEHHREASGDLSDRTSVDAFEPPGRQAAVCSPGMARWRTMRA
jgi:hypothetical protein